MPKEFHLDHVDMYHEVVVGSSDREGKGDVVTAVE